MTAIRVYQFALFGRQNAGKTTFVAALAAPHAAAAGVSVVWRGGSADNPRPPGPEAEWDPEDPATQRYRGAGWVGAAAAALRAGAVPPANPASLHPLRVRYDLSAGGTTYPVEVTDYSGELIDPAVSGDALAAQLRRQLRGLDGVLVLAEAPRPGGAAGLADDLHRLLQAFAILRKDDTGAGLPAGCAVALVVNKFDRRPAGQTAGDFLAGADGATHRRLRDGLTTRNPSDACVFAASAFGASLSSGAGEVPAAGRPLPSVGLEEPFLWAAGRAMRRDAARDLAKIETAAAAARFWRVDHPVTGRARELRADVARMGEAYPPDYPEHATAAAALGRVRWASLRQGITLAVTLLVVLLVGWTVATGLADQRRYLAHEPTLRSPAAADQASLAAAEDWLSGYTARNDLWAPASRLTLTKRRALEHLDAVAAELTSARADVVNVAALNDWDDRLKAVKEEAAVTTLKTEAGSLPARPGRPVTLARQQEFLLRCNGKLAEISDGNNRTKRERDYYRCFNGYQFSDAVAVLSQPGVSAELAAKLRAHFAQETPPILVKLAENAVRDKDARPGCREKLRDCRRKPVADLLATEDLLAIDDMVARLNVADDRHLYAGVVRDRTADACRAYLGTSPLPQPKMKSRVEMYLHHLAAAAAPVEGTVTLTRLEWGSDGWKREDDNQVTVWLNRGGEAAIDVRSVESARGESSQNVAEFKLGGRLDDPVHLRTKVSCQSGNFVFSNRSQGGGEVDTTLRDLLKGVELKLDRFGNRAYFQLTGGRPPEEPLLPQYLE